MIASRNMYSRANLILVLPVVCLLSAVCHAQSEDETVDPTMVRAYGFIGQKPSEAYEHYERLKEEFTKDMAWEDQVAFGRWEWGVSFPLWFAAWEKEWKEHPESHVAFALYIRDEVKKNKHLRSVEELSPTITDDEQLFFNYLQFQKRGSQKDIQEQSALAERLHIPSELKSAVQTPDIHDNVGMIYYHYDNVQSLQKLAEREQQEEAATIATRKAIVPVDRNSQEYQDALLSYKKAVENEEQAISTAQENDPTWAHARYLLETQGLGTVAVIGTEEKKFTETLDDTKRVQFDQWKDGFSTLATIDVIEREWNNEPNSHPAILFGANMASAMMKSKEEGKEFDPSSVVLQEMLGGDETTLEVFFSYLKDNNSESLAQMESLEKDLDISAKLKDAMRASISDTTLFLFYDTYFRTFTPDTVTKAGRDVRDTMAKLDLLRPNWAAEENIEFPDEISRTIHQLGLNDGVQFRWTWWRLLFLSLGILIILLIVIDKIKKYLTRERASK